MNKYIFLFMFFFTMTGLRAQLVRNNLDPNKYAQLDIISSKKGILIPRVALLGTTASLPIATNGSLIPPSLLVFNTNKTTDVDLGYYYWSSNKWNKFVILGQSNLVGMIVYNDTDETFSYTDLSGALVTLDINKVIKDHESNTTLVFDVVGKKLLYTNEDAGTNSIDLSSLDQFRGVAGGDLAGDYPQPMLSGIQGYPIDTTILPNTDDLLQFDGMKWIPAAAAGEPWRVVGTGVEATLNSQNIYQMGNVGIGKQNTSDSIKLDVGSDALINSITVGKALGNLATNTAVGSGGIMSSGTVGTNSGFGYGVLDWNTTGTQNVGIGYYVFYMTGAKAGVSNNTVFGRSAVMTGRAGINRNTQIGYMGADYFGGDQTYFGYHPTGTSGLLNAISIGQNTIISGTNTLRFGNTAVLNVNTDGVWNSGAGVYAGSGTSNANAIIEGSATNKGFLIPRLALTNAGLPEPLKNHVAGMVVYNTASGIGLDAVYPGQYYNDGTRWIRLAISTTEPWYVAGGSTQATSNTQNIYQMASVGLGKQNTSTTMRLDVGSDALIHDVSLGKGGSDVATNTIVGSDVLLENTTGDEHTVLGSGALQANTTGTSNVALGAMVLHDNTTGFQNTALGSGTLGTNTTGSGMTVLGYNALAKNTIGSGNTGVGWQVLYDHMTGSNNTALGFDAGPATPGLSNTTAIGYGAKVTQSNTIRLGNANITDVYTSGILNSTNGIYTGSDVLNDNAILEVNSTTKGLLLPRLSLTNATSFAPLTAHVAGMTVYNVATAGVAPNNVTPGHYFNNGTRWIKLDDMTMPWYVSGEGIEATRNEQNIYQMGSVGIYKQNTSTIIKLDVGSDMLVNEYRLGRGRNNASSNLAFGYQALENSSTIINTVAFGYQALMKVTSPHCNIAIGQALTNATTATDNLAIGNKALQSVIGSATSAAIGYEAGMNSNGSYIAAVGYRALYNNTTGTYNTAVGHGAGPVTGALTNTTAIGYNAKPTASNMVVFGDDNVEYIEGQVAFTLGSDRRYKDKIVPLSVGLDFIKKVHPVEYVRKNSSKNTKEWGVIAQELEQVIIELGLANVGIVQGDATEENYLSVRSDDLIAPMIKAVQELSLQRTVLKGKEEKMTVLIEILKKEIDELKQLLE